MMAWFLLFPGKQQSNERGPVTDIPLALIDTGAFGVPIASRLLRAGFTLTATDKRREAA
jgi:hypothetical protein